MKVKHVNFPYDQMLVRITGSSALYPVMILLTRCTNNGSTIIHLRTRLSADSLPYISPFGHYNSNLPTIESYTEADLSAFLPQFCFVGTTKEQLGGM